MQDNVVPLSPSDYAQLRRPFPFQWTPNLTKRTDGHSVILGVVLFDGTRNDRLHIIKGERQTIEGELYDKLASRPDMGFISYYPGAGTQGGMLYSLFDAAFGYTVKSIAENAVDEIIAKITTQRQSQPNADVRLLVSGFSRGGAAARHFMNTFEQRWDAQVRVGTPPEFYALIFDTVATGLLSNLQLQVPVRADIFYHFVSEDERRIFFDLVVDEPPNSSDKRIVTINLPGAHSDVGASYQGNIGTEYIAYANALLSSMGLTESKCYKVDGDVRSQGKNDSRGVLERLFGTAAPNTSSVSKHRSVNPVRISPMSQTYQTQWHRRMMNLQFTNNLSLPFCIDSNHQLVMLHLTVERFGGYFDAKFDQFFMPQNALIQKNKNNNDYALTFYADGFYPSHIDIPRSILNAMSDGKKISLDTGVVIRNDGSARLWWFVNNELKQELPYTFYRKK